MAYSTLSRRNVLAGLSALGAGFALRPALAKDSKFTAAFSWVPNVEYAGYFLAMDRGYFSAQGLKADFLPGGPNTPLALVSLSAGRADVAFGDWEQFLGARERGNDFVIIAASFPRQPAGLMSLKPIKSVTELRGKRIMLPTATDARLIDALFRLNGMEPDYKAVPTGFSPEPLLAGDGDVYFCFLANQPITLEGMGLKRNKDFFVIGIDELGYAIPEQFHVVARTALDANRDKYVGYLRGLIHGARDNIADPAAGVSITVEKYGASLGLDPHQQLRQNEIQIPLMTGSGSDKLFWFDTAAFAEKAYKIASIAGYKNVAPVDQIVDLSLLEAALAS